MTTIEEPEAPDEKRRDLRIPLRILRVETESRGDVYFGHASNISQSGLFIRTPNPKAIGLQVWVRFELPGMKEKIRCLTEVVWVQDYTGPKGMEPGMGLKFVDLPPDTREIIEKFVNESAEKAES